MIKTLVKHGNSYAIVIDKPILELLRIEPDTELEITTDGQNLVITPQTRASRQEKFERVAKDVMTRYAETFRKLAE